MTDATRASAPADARTLRGYLAARLALALLADPASEPTALDDDALAEAAQSIGGLTPPPAKLALLRASLTDFDVAVAARRLTEPQARALLEAPTSRASSGGRRARDTGDTDGALTVTMLETLTPDAWAELVRWLMEQEGATLEPRASVGGPGLVTWRAEQDDRRLLVCAWRQEPGWPLVEDDLQRPAALAAMEQGARLVIVTTAEATVGARLAIQRMSDARLIDRPALAQALAGLATAYQREQERTRDEAKLRAKAASATRKKLLAALTALDEAARAEPSAQKAAGRPAVRKAATQVEQARRLAAQALMAWETLLAEWGAAFGERPARDGSLELAVEATAYGDLAERADHLKKPMLDALKSLTKTPGDGDPGYVAWRLAVGEELAARCAALRWRAQLVDPAQWQDYAEAVNNLALQEATRAENAATHAAARAERARIHLVDRIGAL